MIKAWTEETALWPRRLFSLYKLRQTSKVKTAIYELKTTMDELLNFKKKDLSSKTHNIFFLKKKT